MTFGGDIAQFCPLQISFCWLCTDPAPAQKRGRLHLRLLSCALEGDARSPIGLGLVRRQGHQAETVPRCPRGQGEGGPTLACTLQSDTGSSPREAQKDSKKLLKSSNFFFCCLQPPVGSPSERSLFLSLRPAQSGVSPATIFPFLTVAFLVPKQVVCGAQQGSRVNSVGRSLWQPRILIWWTMRSVL